MFKIFVFITFFAWAQAELNKIDNNKLKVSIYYESLCPHSAAFITKQFYPAYEHLVDYMNVEFIPYGKASQTFQAGQWSFSCQHGAKECYGNLMHACALGQNKGQDSNVEYVKCAMSKLDVSDKHLKACASKVPRISWDDMMRCKNNGSGASLLAAHGDKTHALRPKLTYVPTIVFNDVYDREVQDGALVNFRKVACRNITGEKPIACSS